MKEMDNKKFCQVRKHPARTSLDIYGNDFRSLSDSELDKSSSMTSEFLDLPRRLSERSTSPLLYCLDAEKLCLDLKADHQKKCLNTGMRERSNTEPPRIQLSNVEVIVDSIDEESPSVSNVYHDTFRNYDNEHFVSRGSGVWINLEPHHHTLLSPRSSNGSICSYRSSNADSAIEMLTPDDDLPEQPLADTSSADYNKLWDSRKRLHSDDLPNISGSYLEGASSSSEVFSTISSTTSQELPSDCSNTMYSNISTTSLSSPDINSSVMTQQILSPDFHSPLLESTHLEQSAVSTPSVVISDYSCKDVLDKGSQTLQSDLETEYNSELLGDRVLYHRSFSSSSISSESSLSIFSDSSDVADLSDFPIKPKPKVGFYFVAGQSFP